MTAGSVAIAAVVDSTPSTAPSFNGSVFAIAYRGDTVYVGGSFTKAIVAGKSVARNRLAAFDGRTGALLPWNPGADNTVRALATDGTVMYAAGDFGVIGAQNRDSLAGLDPTTGVPTALKHGILGQPNALAVAGGRLYLGGRITGVDGVTRANLAAFNTVTGALDTGWAPTTDDTVNALAVANNKIYIGGRFHRANNVPSTLRLTAVDPVTGVVDTTFKPKPAYQVFALSSDATSVYAALGGQGGRALAYTFAGATRWTRVFDGDIQAVTVFGGTTYVGGHFDNACTTTNNGAQGVCTDGSIPRVKLAAIDAQGNLLPWAPQANGVVGVRVMTSSVGLGIVSVGGDFTTINGLTQKRYAAFTDPTARSAGGPPPPASPFVASYNFDSTVADGTFDDGSGHGHLLKAFAANGAVATLVPHGTGQAVLFPPKCAVAATCPRLNLQAANTADLNPGTRDLRFGAAVRLAAAETSSGENIVQKGYSTSGGQYKLQVDGASGKPSCVMSDQNSPTLYVAKSSLSISDGGWHTLECRRAGTSLTIRVDDVQRGAATIPVTLSVVTTQPLRMGGKGLAVNNDQYHGYLDDVWLSIG
ncbi:LamG-like jellyroll fold domain-containing protein [Krasilnikovia sp. MM14-A1004]|uniref:LamG-like jellyroll fold domain-containing protein n=1 Tax=Krasilnikovia sp. MM14-A1004 TaxID=3373541 RepID=UPI00399CEE13